MTTPAVTDGTPLYAQGQHVLSRALAFGILGMTSLGIVFGAIDWAQKPEFAPLPFVALFGVIAFAATRGILRARPIFGSPTGLTVGAGARSRTIPWANVGQPQIPPSSMNPVFRTYYVEIAGESERLYFYGGRREVELIESFRARAAKPTGG